MKKTLTTLWMLALTIGVVFPNFYGSLFETENFGATNFPASLDSLTNPSAGDSVATVSHSAQHSNANDAIEALEAKLGITASTPVANSLLAANGAGSSIWTTYGTTTNFTASNLFATTLGTFASLISQASSTIVGGLTITGNSTTTNATSTISASTNFATSTAYYGAGLTPCSGGSSAIQWTGGLFSCATLSSSVTFVFATSSNSNYLAKTVNLNAGQTVIWETFANGLGNMTLDRCGYKQSNMASTTFYSNGGDDLTNSCKWAYTATTTSIVTVDMLVGNANFEAGFILAHIQ